MTPPAMPPRRRNTAKDAAQFVLEATCVSAWRIRCEYAPAADDPWTVRILSVGPERRGRRKATGRHSGAGTGKSPMAAARALVESWSAQR